MKPDRDNDDLLDDVLAEGAPSAFRATLLEATLQQARRRRRLRLVRRAALPAALLVVVGTLAWWRGHDPETSLDSPAEPPCRIVHTQPFPASAIVTTQSLSTERLIASAPFTAVVHTTPGSGGFRFINDDELLALVGRPAALVRVGPHAQELIFTTPPAPTSPR